MVFSKLKKLVVNKAPGVDSLMPRVLVEAAKCISKPMCVIFESSLREGFVPNDWRRANVTAIYKKGPKDNPGNYRTVSLTSQVCKVMESILKDSITDHLYKYNLIMKTQHGFMKRKSCLTNLLEFLQFTSCQVDKGEAVDAIYLDFQKAFDRVPHKRLLMKIKAHGIVGTIANWIAGWLSDREQRVVLNQKTSEWINVLSGVPQGSVLGPLLFVIYINDIDHSVINRLLKFADDTKVYGVVSSNEQIDSLRADLVSLGKWSEDWLMLFNVEKCKVMHFGKNNMNASYSMGGVVLDVVKEEKDLGVIIQDDLKVSKQCTKAVTTANKILGMISRAFVYRSRDIVLQLYKALVRPHLEYCIQAWRPHLQKDINLLEKVQRRATKMVDALRKYSYEDRLKNLGLTSLETRRLRGDLIEVFKICKGFEDVSLNDFFKMQLNNLRGHDYKIFKTRFRTDCGKFAFANRVINEWNLLTEDIIACDSVDNFKNKLDQHLRYRRGFI
jgi:hypothetical protein